MNYMVSIRVIELRFASGRMHDKCNSVAISTAMAADLALFADELAEVAMDGAWTQCDRMFP